MFKDTIAFSSYSVNDIETSKAFYSNVLGLDVSQPMGQLQLQLAGGAKVFLYGKEDHVPATFTVLNFSVENLELTMNALRIKGVEFLIYKMQGFETDDNGVFLGDGPKIAWFKDPSDNILSIIEE